LLYRERVAVRKPAYLVAGGFGLNLRFAIDHSSFQRVFRRGRSKSLFRSFEFAVTTSNFDLSTVVLSGTWSVYVEMVGQPLILNRISNP
jgi:hypothetical protein